MSFSFYARHLTLNILLVVISIHAERPVELVLFLWLIFLYLLKGSSVFLPIRDQPAWGKVFYFYISYYTFYMLRVCDKRYQVVIADMLKFLKEREREREKDRLLIFSNAFIRICSVLCCNLSWSEGFLSLPIVYSSAILLYYDFIIFYIREFLFLPLVWVVV